MDTIKAAQVVSSANLDVLKEPRGFIKCIELIIAIFAFATTTSHSTSSEFQVTCAEGKDPINVKFEYGYAYRLQKSEFKVPTCNDTLPAGTAHPFGDFSSSAEFYVFVGVMAFLYCIAALVLYIGFEDKYRKYDNVPLIDFVISVVFTLLWLISSSAWAQGVANVKYYTNPEEMFYDIVPECSQEQITCESIKTGNFASLNVSLIFGFLNTGVWAGNLWFLFKETKWFKMRQAPPELPQSPSEEPQRV